MVVSVLAPTIAWTLPARPLRRTTDDPIALLFCRARLPPNRAAVRSLLISGNVCRRHVQIAGAMPPQNSGSMIDVDCRRSTPSVHLRRLHAEADFRPPV